MKKTLLTLLLCSTIGRSASIDVSNYGTDYPHTNIFTTSVGTPLNGSFVGVGYFSSLSDVDLMGLTPTTFSQIASLASDFVELGSILSSAWVEPGGLSGSASATISGLVNSSFIGKGVYVLMGNQSTLASSTELLIAKSTLGNFAADAPIFSQSLVFDQSGGGGNVNLLWGSSSAISAPGFPSFPA